MKKLVLIGMVAALCSMSVVAQDVPRARVLAQQLLDALNAPPPPPPAVGTEAGLDQVLQNEQPRVVVLNNNFIYTKPLTLGSGWVLQNEDFVQTKVGVRVTVDEPLPLFTGGITITGDDVVLQNVDVRNVSMAGTIITVAGMRDTLERVRVLGDPITGQKRGINFTGGLGTIVDSYVDYIAQPAQDTQAIYSQTMLPGGGLLIDNDYLSAAAEAVMFGGGDPADVAHTPSNVVLTNSELTKRPEWLVFVSPGKHAMQSKNALELKNIVGFYSNHTAFKYAGVSEGQGGYPVMFTVRNQGNTAPYSTVQNVLIENFTVDYGAGVTNILGSDNVHPSGTATNIVLRNGICTVDRSRMGFATDGVTYNAAGRLFMFDRAPVGVTFDGISVTGTGVKALGYFTGAPPIGFKAVNMALPTGTTYGWKVDGSTGHGGSGHAALLVYMPDAVLDATVF